MMVGVADSSRGLTRRSFLASSLAVALAACSDDRPEGAARPSPTGAPPATPPPTAQPTATPVPSPTTPTVPGLTADPFTLGVASGDPAPDSVIVWTRLMPGSGDPLPGHEIDVSWQVSLDETFESPVSTGSARASPELGYSVHADAAGLEPDTWYHYRFQVGPFTSPVGRTRTLPGPDAPSAHLRLAFGSCQHWETGHYAAHRHLAGAALDLTLWLGDYIYEAGPVAGRARLHDGPETTELDAYRNRYAQYRSDPDLRAHHAANPWIVTWDDHEVANDYAGSSSATGESTEAFLARRAAAYQAWYEHMPVRLDPPEGPDYRIHRDLVWGELAQLFVLDGRQYRAPQPTDGRLPTIPGFEDQELPLRTLGPTAMDPEHRMLGPEQERWLRDGVAASTRTWKLIGQQVFMHGLNVLPGQEAPVTIIDTWDGYHANRRDILGGFADAGVDNLVVLSGDFHAGSVGELRPDPYDDASPVVGTELMAPSISSSFPEAGADAAPLILAFNPQIRFFEPRNGTTVCELTPQGCEATYLVVTDVTDPVSDVVPVATFVIDAGTPGARRVS